MRNRRKVCKAHSNFQATGEQLEMPDLTRQVTIWDHSKNQPVTVTISNFCNTCGATRGDPSTVLCDTGAGKHWLTRWDNPCGHHDTDAALLNEAALQCLRPGCHLTVSLLWQPYCSDDCIVHHGSLVADSLRDLSDTLNDAAATIRGFHSYGISPTIAAVDKIHTVKKSLGEAEALTSIARDALTKAANLIEVAQHAYKSIDPDEIQRAVMNKLNGE